MHSDAAFIFIAVTFIGTAGGLLLLRTLIARSHFKRVVRRLDRNRASRPPLETRAPRDGVGGEPLIRQMDACEMSNRTDHSPPVPLSRRPNGIETFRVMGTLDTGPVYAQWDGRWAIGSRQLIERVALAMAVDAAFAAPGTEPDSRHPSPSGIPEQFFLAVLTCCDDTYVAEYEIRGQRRAVGPEIDNSARRFRED
jgi:hypothetical protein